MIVEVNFKKEFNSKNFYNDEESEEVDLTDFCQRIDDHLWENGDIVSCNLKFKNITNEN